MRIFTTLILSSCILTSAVGYADSDVLDCAKRSLDDAVSKAKANQTIRFTGTCNGPIVIRESGLVLNGMGGAVIEGGGDVVTIVGATRVALSNVEIRNGNNGLAAVGGASIQLTQVNAHDNAASGITLLTGASGSLSDVIVSRNGVNGLDLETGSAATITGSLLSSFNGVFGINVNGSSITFSQASVSVNRNALGIQIATGSNAFLNDAATVITTSDNLSTGLTVVSGAHLVSFGGTINASGNPVDGVSVNSKGGLDLDAASTLSAFNNGDGVVLQEQSVMTVFNTPQFSGAPGFSTLDVHNNAGTGVRVLSGSTLTLSNQAKITSNQNARVGVLADNGVGLTLINSTLTGNTVKDLQLTFGTRADLQTLVFGTYTCDATVLVRGTSGITCPH